jgi:hypothetical protein
MATCGALKFATGPRIARVLPHSTLSGWLKGSLPPCLDRHAARGRRRRFGHACDVLRPRRSPEPAGQDDRRVQGQRVGGRVVAMGTSAEHYGHGFTRRPVPRSVVPARSRLALQLAPPHFDLRAPGTTIQPRAATPSPIRSGLLMGRVCMGMFGAIRSDS